MPKINVFVTFYINERLLKTRFTINKNERFSDKELLIFLLKKDLQKVRLS
jgi:hypothetical protein